MTFLSRYPTSKSPLIISPTWFLIKDFKSRQLFTFTVEEYFSEPRFLLQFESFYQLFFFYWLLWEELCQWSLALVEAELSGWEWSSPLYEARKQSQCHWWNTAIHIHRYSSAIISNLDLDIGSTRHVQASSRSCSNTYTRLSLGPESDVAHSIIARMDLKIPIANRADIKENHNACRLETKWIERLDIA